MHAMVMHEQKQPLQSEQRVDPVAGSGQVVVRLRAASLNRRDYWITQGMYPGIRLPVVLGSDGAGTVETLGDGVDAQWKDAEVIINPGFDWGTNPVAQSGRFRILGMPDDGTFASHVVVPADALHLRPGHLSWQQAAALPLAGVTAYRALFTQGACMDGDKVLVTGIGGGVATFAHQLAVAAGAQVAVTSSSPDKLQRAQQLGAAAGFDYRDPNWVDQATEQFGAPRLIVDSAGGPGYAALLNLVAAGGRIVNYGATAGPPKFDLFKLFWKQLQIVGSTMGSPQDFEAMLQFVTKHRIEPAIDAVMPLQDANQALQRMQHSDQFGKLVLDVS